MTNHASTETSSQTVDPSTTALAAGQVLRQVNITHQPAVMVLIAMLLIRTVLLFIGDGISYGIWHAIDPERGTWNRALAWSNVFIIAVDLITIAAVARVMATSGSSLRALLGSRTPGRDVAWGLLMFVIAFVAFIATGYIGNLVAYQGAPPQGVIGHAPLWVGVLAITVMPVTIAIAEEVLYRGYLLTVLTRRWGFWAAAVISSVAFSVQHFALTALDAQAWLARGIALFLVGLVFCLLARWMKRLWPLIIGHWLLDVLGLGLPLLSSALN